MFCVGAFGHNEAISRNYNSIYHYQLITSVSQRSCLLAGMWLSSKNKKQKKSKNHKKPLDT